MCKEKTDETSGMNLLGSTLSPWRRPNNGMSLVTASPLEEFDPDRLSYVNAFTSIACVCFDNTTQSSHCEHAAQ